MEGHLLPLPPSDDRSDGLIAYSGGIFEEFEDFSMSMSMISDVAPGWAVGSGPAGDRTTPPQATDVLRIDMRLLRDTRRVLEYLSKTSIG